MEEETEEWKREERKMEEGRMEEGEMEGGAGKMEVETKNEYMQLEVAHGAFR